MQEQQVLFFHCCKVFPQFHCWFYGIGTYQLEWLYINWRISRFNSLRGKTCFPYSSIGFYIEYISTWSSKFGSCRGNFSEQTKYSRHSKHKIFEEKGKRISRSKEFNDKISRIKFNSLNGLNFKIYPGELIAIVGPVGCGKSTLAKSLGRTIEIPDGQLFLDEIDVKTIKLADLRKNISIVPQEAFLFTSTISENLSFGEPKASKRLVEESARRQVWWMI